MKNISKALMAAAIVCLPALVSCEKQGTERFKGNYSFKTSGSITVERDSAYVNDTTYEINGFQIDTIVTVHDQPITISINNESGQMDITQTGDDNVAVTMNVIGGDMVLYYAVAKEKDIVLDETNRHLTLVSFSLSESSDEFGTSPITADVTVNGSGQRYDNIILFSMTYDGDFWANDRLYHITNSDIVCRAKLNER